MMKIGKIGDRVIVRKSIEDYQKELQFLDRFSLECQVLDEFCLEDFINSQFRRIKEEFEEDYEGLSVDDLLTTNCEVLYLEYLEMLEERCEDSVDFVWTDL